MSSRSQGSLASRITIAGSLPKPGWLAGPDQLWAGWLHEGEPLAEAKLDAVRIAVLDQELAGLGIVTDGVAAIIAAVAEHIPPQRIYPSTICGMVPFARPVAVAKMSALARGAALVS
jgi:methionine synthase II (cobalamin-independent)